MRNLIQIIEAASSGPRTLADVANYFLDSRGDLLDDDEEIDRDMDEATALEIIRREYVSGTCGAFAIALHDKTGYPIIGMNGGMHVAVQAPDGEVIDFLGKAPLEKVLRRYGMKKTTPVKQWTREEAVHHVMLTDDEDESELWSDIEIAKWVMNKLGRW